MIRTIFFCLIFSIKGLSQYNLKTFNWSDAGFKGAKPVYTQTLNILNYGGDNTNSLSNNTAFNTAVTALNNKGGVIYFPAGNYRFTSSLNFNRDSITIKGAGYDSTTFRFYLGGNGNCVNIYGSQLNSDTSSFASHGLRDSSQTFVLNSSAFAAGDWVYLQTNDLQYMISSWAYNSLGQVLQIQSISGNEIKFHSPFRFNYVLSIQPKITKLSPRRAIGIECVRIVRTDASTNQTSNISYDKAIQCWIEGIESDSCNFAHIELNRSANIDITNSWIHRAFAYGGNGQAYGITFQFSSSECKAENNILQRLRHSILFQAGPNGNVCAYNYSFDPYWTQSFFPANSAGDIVFHGNYPFANLCEGNINQNTVIDNSHGKNGTYNTLFRNRSELYGLVMNNSPATDTVQFLGLEITNTTAPYGQFVTYGTGHLFYGNRIQGVLTPTGSAALSENSLYLLNNQKPLCYTANNYNWPVIGIPNTYNTGINPARHRFIHGKMASCECPNLISTSVKESDREFRIFPNPASDFIQLDRTPDEVTIINMTAEILRVEKPSEARINTSLLPNGTYIVKLKWDQHYESHKLLIQR